MTNHGRDTLYADRLNFFADGVAMFESVIDALFDEEPV